MAKRSMNFRGRHLTVAHFVAAMKATGATDAEIIEAVKELQIKMQHKTYEEAQEAAFHEKLP
jgi:alkylhydroperoxidase/carboxymuconolactone decarboxylase family protein YurZ